VKRILFTDRDLQREHLFPLILTRPAQEMRVGILTIREKWERALKITCIEQPPQPRDAPGSAGQTSFVRLPGNLLPPPALVQSINALGVGQFLQGPDGAFLGASVDGTHDGGSYETAVAFNEEVRKITYPWHISGFNAWAIGEDWHLLTNGAPTHPLSATNWVTGHENIYLESGVQMECCFLNATEGPIYIGKNALIMEGVSLRGPVSIGEGAVVKMGARLYSGTTIGPHCTAGGEIKNSVLFGYSNKAHDGYLGDSVVGEWCNLGAGTSNSNLTNSASEVMVYTPGGFVSAGLKCGLIMGDYSRTAINTSINTGTVIGVSCNVHGAGLTPKYIPSFSWGMHGPRRYDLSKAIEHISNWKRLKHKSLEEQESAVLRAIFDAREQ
jgi:UDP-N-acetylglucosamine diphosphorylase/glucosamine-1-phosphate N-acetyltransferase